MAQLLQFPARKVYCDDPRMPKDWEPVGTDAFLDPAGRDYVSAYARRRENNPRRPDDFPPRAA